MNKNDDKNKVCPVENAGRLEFRLRKWLQKPNKILTPFVKNGMSVLDYGCGPGFFTLDIARIAGKSGKVIAVDLQDGMLNLLREKINGTELEKSIILHKCEEDKIDLDESVDLIFAFYVIHEVKNKEAIFNELHSMLNSGGKMLIAEPPFHVSKQEFTGTVQIAKNIGFKLVGKPKIMFSQTALLEKEK